MIDIDEHFRAFGLTSSATLAEVKETRQLYIKAFHPDRYPKDSNDQKKAEDKQKALNLAFEHIQSWFSSGSSVKSKAKPARNSSKQVRDWHSELDEYMTYIAKSDRCERTLSNIFCDLVRFSEFLENSKLHFASDFNSEQAVLKYYRRLRDLHYSASTIARHLYSIRGWFTFCRFDADFILDLTSECMSSVTREVKSLTEHQATTLLSSVKRYARKEEQNLVEFLLHTGLTAGELCGMCWKDVSASRSGGKKLSVMLVIEGRSKFREIPLNDKAVDLLVKLGLREYLKNQNNDANRPIFIKDGFGLTPKMVHYMVSRCGVEAGVEVTPSLLRNSFASKLVSSGVPRHHLAEYLGISEQSAGAYYPTKTVTVADLVNVSKKR